MEQPLAEYFSGIFDIPVFLNNDTRCFGQAERIIGKAREANHAIVINLSRGLGTSLIVDNKIVNGGLGFAGELGHMQFGNKQKMCLCGKKGCLGNDVGGFALEENFMEKIGQGEKTIVELPENGASVRYDDILLAALEGDDLSIKLVQEMGYKLGHALGNIINLLNPELIIIGGKFAKLKDLLLDPVKTGLSSSALVSSLRYCNIEFSELGDLAGLKGAGALVFEYFELIKN
jgi:predicted NBD/HSP70 family sugar kinase